MSIFARRPPVQDSAVEIFVREAASDAASVEAGRKFLRDWIERMRAVYLAVSLPPDFRYPAADPNDATARARQTMLEQVVFPVCAERGLPRSLLVWRGGGRRGVPPAAARAAAAKRCKATWAR